MSTKDENQVVVKTKVEEILKRSLQTYLTAHSPVTREEAKKRVLEILDKFKEQSLIDGFEAKFVEEDEDEKNTREVLEEPLRDIAIEAEIRHPQPIETIKFQLVTSKKS
jgi:hypothetical protein